MNQRLRRPVEVVACDRHGWRARQCRTVPHDGCPKLYRVAGMLGPIVAMASAAFRLLALQTKEK